MIRLSTPQASTLPAQIRAFSDLTRALGTPGFPAALLDCLGQWAACEHFSVLRMDGARPQLLAQGPPDRAPVQWPAPALHWPSRCPVFRGCC